MWNSLGSFVNCFTLKSLSKHRQRKLVQYCNNILNFWLSLNRPLVHLSPYFTMLAVSVRVYVCLGLFPARCQKVHLLRVNQTSVIYVSKLILNIQVVTFSMQFICCQNYQTTKHLFSLRPPKRWNIYREGYVWTPTFARWRWM